MTRNARRRVIRAASASLLAAAVGLTGSVAAAPGASARPQPVQSAEPTPSPGEGESEAPPPGEGEREEPPPGEGESEAPPPGEGESEAPPPGEGESEAPPPGEGEREEPPPGEGESEAPPPGEDGGAPPAEGGAPAPQTPDEIRTRIEAGLASSDLSDEDKATVQKSLETVLGILNDPNASSSEKDLAGAVGAGLDEVLKLSMDPATSAEDKARYDQLVVGVSEAMAKITDAPVDQQDASYAVFTDLNVTLANLAAPNLSPAAKVYYSLWADQILGGLLAVQQPTTTPKQQADRERVQQKLKRNARALKTYQSSSASQADRDAAKRTLDEQAGATNDATHQELVAELKRLKAPQACLDVMRNRTQQAGWPDGSLWGLSDTACADAVRTGAQDGGSDWSALFQCVIDNPFSTCDSRIPED
ncbi:hypothetical protein [Streptomyces aureus]|uniref:hypothetical protein n=1 Tax=Streptomyces aureus TaxID=193461 RepID=UPI0006E42E72|nr:hypothetical protein [Streptomyces aureus]